MPLRPHQTLAFLFKRLEFGLHLVRERNLLAFFIVDESVTDTAQITDSLLHLFEMRVLIAMLAALLMTLRLNLVNNKSLTVQSNNGITEANPSDRTALSGITEVHLVTLIPRSDCGDCKSNLMLIGKPLCCIVKPCIIDGLVDDAKEIPCCLRYAVLIRIIDCVEFGIAVVIIHPLECLPEVIAVAVYHLLQSPVCVVGNIDGAGLLVTLFYKFEELFTQVKHPLILVKVGILGVVVFLNDNLILTDVVQNFLLGDGFLVRSTEPVGKTNPLVFTGLETAFLLKHLEPLFRCCLLHLDTACGLLCVRDEDALVGVDLREADVLAYLDVIIVEDNGTRTIHTAIVLHSDKSCLMEYLGGFLACRIGIAKSILQTLPNLQTGILFTLNDVGKGLESLREPVRSVEVAVKFAFRKFPHHVCNLLAERLGKRLHLVDVVLAGIIRYLHMIQVAGKLPVFLAAIGNKVYRGLLFIPCVVVTAKVFEGLSVLETIRPDVLGCGLIESGILSGHIHRQSLRTYRIVSHPEEVGQSLIVFVQTVPLCFGSRLLIIESSGEDFPLALTVLPSGFDYLVMQRVTLGKGVGIPSGSAFLFRDVVAISVSLRTFAFSYMGAVEAVKIRTGAVIHLGETDAATVGPAVVCSHSRSTGSGFRRKNLHASLCQYRQQSRRHDVEGDTSVLELLLPSVGHLVPRDDAHRFVKS